MGLLDIWSEWKKNNQTYKSGFEDYTDTEGAGTLETAGGVEPKGGFEGIFNRSGQSPFVKNPPFTKENFKKVGNKIINAIPGGDFDKKWAIEQANKINQNKEQWVGDGPWKMRSGRDSKFHANQAEQMNWWQKFADKFDIDFDKAQASWKDKGGFEGLMANPAFTMGLAFMQAGAEGKVLGQGALDNVMKAAGISSHYKKILEDRKMEPIQATAGDIAEVKDMLKSINIEEGNWLENLFDPKAGAKYEAAVEEIAVQFQKEIREKQKALKKAGKSQIIRRTDQLKILQKLVDSNVVQKKENFLNRIGITSGTISMPLPMAEGGPIKAGKPYLVGEEGPEVIIPKSDGNVLANDDSQIFAMLLASNPQLQNVSRQRAEKILRSRFPEYFEV